MRKRLTGIASTPNKATQHGIPRLSLGWLALLLYSLSTAQAAATTDDPVALQARITRVEQGLSPRVVVKGAPRPAMTLQARMAYHHVPAVSIALIDHGQVQWARAYGVADATSGQAATPATLFQAASISTTVAAVAALRMTEQGQLALDRPANDDLTHWQMPDNAFTAQQAVSLQRVEF
ncbi:serine hydrolase domain-containing protein [Stenotrophomonas sp.]|uniref:serine hydrolase domain-containing protein n=1 Tax=Stenotrophomonas sp. TaxID=69392 RepID=UPI002FC7355C